MEFHSSTNSDHKINCKAFGRQIVNWNLYKKGGSNIIGFSLIINNFNQKAAELAYEALFKRHESLRTTFSVKNNQVIQSINEYNSQNYRLDYYKPKSWQELKRMVMLIHSYYKKILSNLEKGPLAKGAIFVMNQESYFTFRMHHTISDAYSINLIMQELSILYEAYRVENLNPMLSPPAQLRHFTEYQHKNYNLDEIKRYWIKTFKRVKPIVDYDKLYKNYFKSLNSKISLPILPLNRTSINFSHYSKIANYSHGKQYNERIDGTLFDKLQEKTKVAQATPYTILLSVLNVLFYKLYSCSKILFVSRIDGRTIIETPKAVGNLTGIIFLLNELKASMTFEEVLEKVSDNFYTSSQHIVYNVQQLGNIPAFTGSHLCINYLNEQGNLEFSRPKSQAARHTNEKSYFPLCAEFIKYRNVILVKWIYNPLIFRPNVIEFFAAQLTTLWKHLIRNYEGELKDISFHSK